MRIIKAVNVSNASKPEGTDVHYYLFSDYEVHYNEQAAHTTQTWHHHEIIQESLYVIEGELVAKWLVNDEKHSQIVRAGDMVETERSPHTFENVTDTTAKFIVIKRIPVNGDYSEVFKTDKVLD